MLRVGLLDDEISGFDTACSNRGRQGGFMKKAKSFVALGLGVVIAAAFAFVPAHARQTSTVRTLPPPAGQATMNTQLPDGSKSEPDGSVHQRFQEQAAKARNTERFKRIQSDTDKLLRLSTELKEDVDKSTKNELSLDVIRKAAEVEKLAHDVKERMKG